jgi:tetratricopeptide (TPR) repeat protein
MDMSYLKEEILSYLHKSMVKTFAVFAVLSCIFLSASSVSSAFVNEDRITLSKSLAHYAIGKVYDFLGMANDAVLEYQKSIQYDDSVYLPHLHLGADYARLSLFNEAKGELVKVHQLNPEDMQSHYLLALIYSSEHDYDKAAGEYELILKKFSTVEPENVEIYGYLAQLYYSQKKYSQAIEQFKKMLQLDPENADVMYLLGSLYVEIKDSPRAIDILKKSITLEPDHDGSLNTLGFLYAEEGKNLDEAQKLIEHALEVSPDNGAYLDSLGWVYYKKGMYDKAFEVLQNADKILKDPVIYDHMGDVCSKMNKTQDAIHYWELSLQLQPGQDSVIKKINKVKNGQVVTNVED